MTGSFFDLGTTFIDPVKRIKQKTPRQLSQG